jgi:outer membrane protein OmpA-like peptidoglycan-associated protein
MPIHSPLPHSSAFRRPVRGFACALALLVAVTGCQRGSDAPAQPATPSAPRVQIDATLGLADNSGSLRFDGTVDSEATRTAIERALLAVYGNGRAQGAIDVDPAATPPIWAKGLEDFLRALSTVPGAGLRLAGNQATLSGPLDADQRRALRTAAERAFPGMRLSGLFEPPGDDPAAGAKLSPEVLAKTLNETDVAFKPGSGEVSDDSLALVAQAADAIRAAPEGTRLLIVGPVTPTSDATNDVFLSKQRAEALKVQLILQGVNPATIETRGWGQNADGTPVENATPPQGGASMRFELLG